MPRSAGPRAGAAIGLAALVGLAGLAGASPARSAVALAAEPPSRAERLVFSAPAVELVLGGDGRALGLVDRATGAELLADAATPFALARSGGRDLPASRIEAAIDGSLLVRFGDAPEPVARLTIAALGAQLAVTLVEVRGAGVERIELVRLPVATGDQVGSTLAVRAGPAHAVALIPGAETVETTAARGGRMVATAHAELGLVPARVAIVSAPASRLEAALEEVERALGIPSPRLGGRWAKVSDAARRSYLFADMTAANADEMLRWARRGGFAQVLVYASTWAESPGSYRVSERSFPGGEAGLARVVEHARAAGIGVGLHVLTSLVGKRDPLASPVPDPRLLVDARATLARGVGPDDAEIELSAGAEDFPESASTHGNRRAGTDVRIGAEVVRYRAIERAAGGRRARLVGCTRGANGTVRSAHGAGTAVEHLAERYGAYLVDLRTSLAADVAARIAGLVDRLGVDMLYLDAGEVNDANGPRWYWVGRQQSEILARIRRPILVQGSGMTAWTWHMFTRGACDDGVVVGGKAWLDEHKIGRSLAAYRRNRMPAELGWWRLDAESVDRPATPLDEAELLGVRSLAWDAPFSVETTLDDLRRHPAAEAILRRLALYERVRLERAVGEEVRARLRVGEWRLATGESAAAAFEPVDPARSTASRRAYAPPGDARNRMLVARDGRAPAAPPDGPIAVPVRDAAAAGVLVERLALPSDRAWLEPAAAWLLGRETARLAGVDLSRHGALAVSLRVERAAAAGDGPPAVLNVQLEAVGERFRDHLVDLRDLGGDERTIVLDAPSPERVVRELPPAPGTYALKAALSTFDRSRVVAVNLRWMRGAPSAGTRLRVTRVEALADLP